MTVISVEHLSKSYRLGQIGTGTLTNDLKVWWAKALGKPNPLLKIGQKDPSIRPSSTGNRPSSSASVSPSSTKDEKTKDGMTKDQGPGTKDETTDVGRPRTKDEGLADHDSDTIWALKDVSFSVKQGEVLGIIGRNGAGKSTILKILSRITAPTEGEVKAKGRIASLLEVGTGFHPELTGRENTYLNGAILGMTKAEVDRKFDEIVAFSEVEQFIDTPVKRYSSGMYVRLAFAVAAHLDPEILLVDEVLAVGDAAFQKKCLGKMEDVAKGGRTVLFVSHNLAAIQSLCPRALLISEGRVTAEGDAGHVIDRYGSSNVRVTGLYELTDHPRDGGDGELRIERFRVVDSKHSIAHSVRMGDAVRFEIDYRAGAPKGRAEFVIGIYGRFLQPVCQLSSSGLSLALQKGTLYGTVSCLVPRLNLTAGRYVVNLAIVDPNRHDCYDHLTHAAEFLVEEADVYKTGRIPSAQDGPCFLEQTWAAQRAGTKTSLTR
jgi:lipopolysaccharide transport system ATP-binding protein